MESHKPSTSKDLISRKIKQLPESDKNLLKYGSAYLGLNAALGGGLIANLECETRSISFYLTNGYDPIFDSKPVLPKSCKFTFEYR